MTTIETTIEVDERRKATIQLPANMKPGRIGWSSSSTTGSQMRLARPCLARPRARDRLSRVPREIVGKSGECRRAAPCSNSWTRCRRARGVHPPGTRSSVGSRRSGTHGIVDPVLLRTRVRRCPDLQLQRREASDLCTGPASPVGGRGQRRSRGSRDGDIPGRRPSRSCTGSGRTREGAAPEVVSPKPGLARLSRMTWCSTPGGSGK